MLRKICTVLGLLVVALADGNAQQTAAPKRDEGEVAAHALLDRAIQAAGGAAALSKVNAVTAKVKGAFAYTGNKSLAVSFSGSYQGSDRFRLDLETLQTTPLEVTLVANGSKSWTRTSSANSRFATKSDLLKGILFEAGLKQDLYAVQLAQLLLPLKDKEFQLSHAGEIKIKDRPALGLRVVHEGNSDVIIYLDKESALPLQCELRLRADKTNEEFTHHILFGDFMEVDGIKHFTKIAVNRDDTKIFEAELTAVQFHEKLDAKVFAEP